MQEIMLKVSHEALLDKKKTKGTRPADIRRKCFSGIQLGSRQKFVILVSSFPSLNFFFISCSHRSHIAGVCAFYTLDTVLARNDKIHEFCRLPNYRAPGVTGR